MGKTIVISCDSCKRGISKPYQTLSVRRYTESGKCLRGGTIWLCDKCYNRMVTTMLLPPYDEEVEK